MTSKLIKKLKRLALHGAQGFTLIETLIAILILVTAITGPLTIASRSVIAGQVAKDQITAFYLAQDAIEYVRFVRDTNRLNGADWVTGAGGSGGASLIPCTTGNGCYLDSTDNEDLDSGTAGTQSIAVCSAACPAMKYDTSTNRFSYLSGSNTLFTRQVKITSPSPGDPNNERVVTVTVTWTNPTNNPHTVTIVENIYNWQ